MIIYFSLAFYLTILSLQNSSAIFHVLIGSFPGRVSVIAFVSDNLKGGGADIVSRFNIARRLLQRNVTHWKMVPFSQAALRMTLKRAVYLFLLFNLPLFCSYPFIFFIAYRVWVTVGALYRDKLTGITFLLSHCSANSRKMRLGLGSVDIIIGEFKPDSLKKQITFHLDK